VLQVTEVFCKGNLKRVELATIANADPKKLPRQTRVNFWS